MENKKNKVREGGKSEEVDKTRLRWVQNPVTCIVLKITSKSQ